MTIPAFLGRPGLGAAGVLVAALLVAFAAYVALRLVARHARPARRPSHRAAARHDDADIYAMQQLISPGSRNADLSDTLCAKVREALIDFLQREHPECLPRLRIEGMANVHNGAP